MPLIKRVEELLKQKNIPDSDFKIIISGFNASVVSTAMQKCEISQDVKNISEALSHFEEIEEISRSLRKSDLSLDKAELTSKEIAFLTVYRSTLEDLLTNFITKLEEM
jgi:hypothetical protein